MSANPTQEPYRTRLLEIAETISSPCYEGHFHMSDWLSGGSSFNLDFKNPKWHVHDDLVKKLQDNASLHACGTVACIGGTMELVLRRQGLIKSNDVGVDADSEALAQIKEYYGLDDDTVQLLFYPGGGYMNIDNGAEAAHVIRHLAETGEVDWSKADK